MNTGLFDKFLRLLDLHLDGILYKEQLESSFTEEEWDELYGWVITLIDLMRGYDGCVETLIEENKRKARSNPHFKNDIKRSLHLKKLLDENPTRIIRFEEMVSYLENKRNEKVSEHF